MEFRSTPLKGLYVAASEQKGDERGAFMRLFCADEIQKTTGFKFDVKQANYSFTAEKGTVRGLHFQNEGAPEGKIVRCIKGSILDVAVDIRVNSPTFLKHFAVELSEKNNEAMIIPPGFAHGFQALEDNCVMIYMHNANYSPQHEGGLRYDDKLLNINWPLKAVNVSARDDSFKPASGFNGVRI